MRKIFRFFTVFFILSLFFTVYGAQNKKNINTKKNIEITILYTNDLHAHVDPFLFRAIDEKENILKWVVELALDRINNNKSWNYNSELLQLVGEVFKDKFKDFEAAINSFGAENTDAVFKKYIDFSNHLIKKFEDNIAELASEVQQVFELSTEDLDLLNKVKTGQLYQLQKIIDTLNSVAL